MKGKATDKIVRESRSDGAVRRSGVFSGIAQNIIYSMEAAFKMIPFKVGGEKERGIELHL